MKLHECSTGNQASLQACAQTIGNVLTKKDCQKSWKMVASRRLLWENLREWLGIQTGIAYLLYSPRSFNIHPPFYQAENLYANDSRKTVLRFAAFTVNVQKFPWKISLTFLFFPFFFCIYTIIKITLLPRVIVFSECKFIFWVENKCTVWFCSCKRCFMNNKECLL